MGFFKKVLGNTVSKALGMPDQRFIEFVRANDNGEEWAEREFQRLWSQNDETLIPRIHRARVFIYEAAARQGDRDAIIKYARGLAWSGRENEALDWYMRLINAGDVDAMYELSHDYNQYGGFGENEAEELKWMKRAAEGGHARAQYSYGLEMASKGYRKEANYWFQKSAENGDPKGMVKYAEKLHWDIMTIDRFMKGIPESSAGEYDCVKEYQIQSNEDAASKIIELRNTCDDFLCEAVNMTEDPEEQAEAFRVLSSLYLICPENVYNRNPYLGYYYNFLWSYIMFDGDCSGKWWNDFLQKIRRENLNITIADLDEWKRPDCMIDEWMQRKGIAM